MPNPRSSKSQIRTHHRLWPLFFLPFLGLLVGLYFQNTHIDLPFAFGQLDRMGSVVLGLLAGCGAMVISASVILAYRLSQTRFTIGAILVTIAVIAALLAWARSVLV
jgi:hypothetical protein